MSNKPPIVVPQGAIRLNTDTQKLEFYVDNRWYEMATHNTNLGRETDVGAGGRGIFSGGRSNNKIQFITISSAGDASNFGDLTRPITSGSGTESPTRGFFAGGYTRPVYNPPFKAIEFTNFSSLGNTVRFGELFTGRYRFAGCSSPTRGIFMGGRTPSNLDVIEYFTMSTEGNGQDFGNLPAALGANAAASNQTRGLSMGGGPGSGDVNTISYITISTTGDATDFGDLTEAIQDISAAASDSHGGLG